MKDKYFTACGNNILSTVLVKVFIKFVVDRQAIVDIVVKPPYS